MSWTEDRPPGLVPNRVSPISSLPSHPQIMPCFTDTDKVLIVPKGALHMQTSSKGITVVSNLVYSSMQEIQRSQRVNNRRNVYVPKHVLSPRIGCFFVHMKENWLIRSSDQLPGSRRGRIKAQPPTNPCKWHAGFGRKHSHLTPRR